MLPLITFEGCPTVPRMISLLEDMGVEFNKIDQTLLFDITLRPLSLLQNGTILFGSHTDGESGCSLAIPSNVPSGISFRTSSRNTPNSIPMAFRSII
jgi:hypothetical protein